MLQELGFVTVPGTQPTLRKHGRTVRWNHTVPFQFKQSSNFLYNIFHISSFHTAEFVRLALLHQSFITKQRKQQAIWGEIVRASKWMKVDKIFSVAFKREKEQQQQQIKSMKWSSSETEPRGMMPQTCVKHSWLCSEPKLKLGLSYNK